MPPVHRRTVLQALPAALAPWAAAGLGLAPSPSRAQAQAQTQGTHPDNAAQRISALWQRYRQGVETEQETVNLLLNSATGSERKRLQRSVRYRPDGFVCLVRFAEPALDKGLTLLIDQQGRSTQMWLRMPSWGQARRVAADREARSFGGTDLSFEDNRQLLGEAVADWAWRTLDDGRIEASQARMPSGYGRRLLRLGADGLLHEIQYLDTQGRLLKTQQLERLSLQGERWRADAMRVDVSPGTPDARRTELEVVSRQFGLPELTEAWFQRQVQA